MTHAVHARPMRSHVLAGAVAAFVGLSLANTLPAVLQLALYLTAMVAVVRRPHGVPPLAEAAVLLAAGAYLVMLRAALGVELDGALRLLRPCFEGFLLAHVLYKWCGIRDFRAAVLVLAGAIALQFAASLWMLLDPPGRLAFMERMYSDEGYQHDRFTAALLFRGYGLSRHHLYGLPLAVGLSAALMLVVASIDGSARRRWWLGALAALALLLVAVNARIGFVPLFVCYVGGVSVLFNRYYPGQVAWMVALLVLPLLFFGAAYFGDDFQTLLSWLAAGYEQLGDSDAEATTFGELRDMLVLAPDLASLLFGDGLPCSTDKDCYSDIGFIRAIQEGGVLFLVAVLFVYARLNRHVVRFFERSFGRARRRQRRAALLVAWIVYGTFVAAMVKGEAHGTSDYSRLVATLACLGLLCARPRRVPALAEPGPRAGVVQGSPALAAD
jgi:hypothetical protein